MKFEQNIYFIINQFFKLFFAIFIIVISYWLSIKHRIKEELKHNQDILKISCSSFYKTPKNIDDLYEYYNFQPLSDLSLLINKFKLFKKPLLSISQFIQKFHLPVMGNIVFISNKSFSASKNIIINIFIPDYYKNPNIQHIIVDCFPINIFHEVKKTLIKNKNETFIQIEIDKIDPNSYIRIKFESLRRIDFKKDIRIDTSKDKDSSTIFHNKIKYFSRSVLYFYLVYTFVILGLTIMLINHNLKFDINLFKGQWVPLTIEENNFFTACLIFLIISFGALIFDSFYKIQTPIIELTFNLFGKILGFILRIKVFLKKIYNYFTNI